MQIEDVLNAYKSGDIELAEALASLQNSFMQDLGHTVLDHNRALRTGSAEVVFGEGKSAAHISDIIRAMMDNGTNVLVTRVEPDKYQALTDLPAEAVYYDDAGLLSIVTHTPPTVATSIAVVSAGTSDVAVAEEAARTAEFFGNEVTRIYDVGVAGLHRLLARLDDLRQARVLVVVAGMEGALPSVVGGLVDKPVIAVPTSIGYGAAFDGVAALLGMLTTCASGVSVVNIDNGFGAGFLANRINRL